MLARQFGIISRLDTIYLFIYYLFIKTYLYRVVYNQIIIILFYRVALLLANGKSSDNLKIKIIYVMTCARRAFLNVCRLLHVLICSGNAFHIAGPLFAKEFSKRARGAWGTVTKLEEVDALVSLTAISLYIVMQSERYDGDIP